MSVGSWFANVLSLGNTNDDEYFDDDEYEVEKSPRRSMLSNTNDDEYDDIEEQRPRLFSKNKPQPIRRPEVTVVIPSSIEDAQEICEYLLAGKAVVINMEEVKEIGLAQRIIDFTSGATYAINGNLQKISNYIFIASPEQIELSGDFQQLFTGGTIEDNSLNIRV